MSAAKRTKVTGEMVGAATCLAGGVSLAVYSAAQLDWASTQASFAQFAASAVVVTAACVAVKVHGFARTIGGRKMVVRTHAGHGTTLAARHEGGHIALAKAAGGRVTGAYIYPDGSGVTYIKMPASASIVDHIAVDVAGEVAAGTNWGCESDQAYMRAALASLPAGERSAAKKAGYARASNVVNGFFSDGGVSSAAERLLRDGRY